MVHKCCANGCKNRRVPENKISFYHFPKNDDLKMQWLTALNLDPLKIRKSSMLCANHFTKEDFIAYHAKNRLKSNAIPITPQTQLQDNFKILAKVIKTVIDNKNKKRRMHPKRYVGDFKESDMENPVLAKKFFLLANNKIKDLQKQIKALERRLQLQHHMET